TASAGTPTTTSNQASLTIFATQSPSRSITKTSTDTTHATAGQTLQYRYKKTNNGNVTLAGPFTVTDGKANTTGPSSPSSLAPVAITTSTCTYGAAHGDLHSCPTRHSSDLPASSRTPTAASSPASLTIFATQSPS